MKTQINDKIMNTPNPEEKPDTAATSGRVLRVVSLFECLTIMYEQKSKGQAMQIYADKREKQIRYLIIKNDDGQNPIAEISHETFKELREKKVITGNTMHFAWKSEKGVHEFIG